MPPTTTEQLLYRVPEAMHLLRLSRTTIYELIRSGRLRSIKQGRTRLVSITAMNDYIALLEDETMGKAA